MAEPPAPPVLVKIHRGITFTVDQRNGLRAWMTRESRSLITSLAFTKQDNGGNPSALGVDTRTSKAINVYVGFQDGSFAVYELCAPHFRPRHSHPPSSHDPLVAITAFSPYIITMSKRGTFSVYRFDGEVKENGALADPRLLLSLQSNHLSLPISLSIRPAVGAFLASIAYSYSRLGCGWCLGLQEIRLTTEGEISSSRLTSSVEASTTDFQPVKYENAINVDARSTVSEPFALHPQIVARPTSLSYSHPYLLAALPDNTLMSHLVISNTDKLEIVAGRRLWGHTSSVSDVQVSERGKAVSVSSRGGEMRLWELEDMLSSSSSSPLPSLWRRASKQRRSSVRVQPRRQDSMSLGTVSEALLRRGDCLGLVHRHATDADGDERRSWVGFDDEQVIVLAEHCRRQVLSCYDFT